MSDALVQARGGRPLRFTGIAIAALALTAFFMVLRFPYDRLVERIAAEIEQNHGIEIRAGAAAPAWVAWGPGLRIEALRLSWPDGQRLDLERAGLRPALSLSWLRFDPALRVVLESAQGEARGVWTLGENGGFRGPLRDVDLSLLPQPGVGRALRLEGRADAEIDVVLGERGALGEIRFEARDGTLNHPQLPIPLPYQRLAGTIALSENGMTDFSDLELESPLATGQGKGRVGPGRTFAQAPLNLEIDLQVSGAIRSSLASQGVKVARDGRIRLRVTGTPTRPSLR